MVVNKTNEWSIPKPYADLKTVSERYRNMGRDLFQEVEMYICLNRDIYKKSFVAPLWLQRKMQQNKK